MNDQPDADGRREPCWAEETVVILPHQAIFNILLPLGPNCLAVYLVVATEFSVCSIGVYALAKAAHLSPQATRVALNTLTEFGVLAHVDGSQEKPHSTGYVQGTWASDDQEFLRVSRLIAETPEGRAYFGRLPGGRMTGGSISTGFSRFSKDAVLGVVLNSSPQWAATLLAYIVHGPRIFASIETIQNLTGVSRSTTALALKNFERNGILINCGRRPNKNGSPCGTVIREIGPWYTQRDSRDKEVEQAVTDGTKAAVKNAQVMKQSMKMHWRSKRPDLVANIGPKTVKTKDLEKPLVEQLALAKKKMARYINEAVGMADDQRIGFVFHARSERKETIVQAMALVAAELSLCTPEEASEVHQAAVQFLADLRPVARD